MIGKETYKAGGLPQEKLNLHQMILVFSNTKEVNSSI